MNIKTKLQNLGSKHQELLEDLNSNFMLGNKNSVPTSIEISRLEEHEVCHLDSFYRYCWRARNLPDSFNSLTVSFNSDASHLTRGVSVQKDSRHRFRYRELNQGSQTAGVPEPND